MVLQVWCCVVKHGLVTLVVIMILKDTATFQVLFIVILCLEHYYCGDHSTVAFTYLKDTSTKCFCLLPVVFVLLFWSWSCEQRSWSCYFGLGLKNLVLFTSLVLEGRRSQSCHCYRTNVSWYKTTISSYRSQNTVHSNSNQIWPFMSLSHTVHSAAIWQTWWN